MDEFRLTMEAMRYIALFESLTNAVAIDCIIDDENCRVVFVIKKGHMGLAIGKNGININKVKTSIKKEVELVEYSEDVTEFIISAFQPASIRNINIVNKKNKKFAYLDIPMKDKGIAIGKNGKNIQKVKLLTQRHHSLDDIIIQ